MHSFVHARPGQPHCWHTGRSLSSFRLWKYKHCVTGLTGSLTGFWNVGAALALQPAAPKGASEMLALPAPPHCASTHRPCMRSASRQPHGQQFIPGLS